MSTVREPALSLERDDVVERLFEPIGSNPEVKLSHAWVVDDEPSARQDDELSPRRGVPARAVRPDGAGREEILAGQGVDKGGLSHAGRTEQSARHSRVEVGADVLETHFRANRHAVHGNPELRQLGGCLVDIDVRYEVGLREKQHGLRTALPGQGEVTLEESATDLLADRGDDEHDIDVRRDDLLSHIVRAWLVRRAPGELRAAGENRTYRRQRIFRGIERDPVADHGKLRPCLDVASRASGQTSAHLSALGENVVCAAMLDRDPARLEPRGTMECERLGPATVPAERREVVHARIVADERRQAAARFGE